jgi:excinuclease ABC subunit C
LPDEDFNFILFKNYFKSTKNHEINFFYPNKNKHKKLKKLLESANKNAQNELEKEYFLKNKNKELLKTLKKNFNLNNFPQNIECYDNSNLQGTNPVASKVEFRNAMPYKKGYRHFKIKTVEGINDYASMKEIIKRRLTSKTDKDYPNLIICDS